MNSLALPAKNFSFHSKTMSQEDVKKNFELADTFTQYVVRHPETVKGVGRNASIVMIDPKNKQLTQKNLALAHRLREKRRVVYIASRRQGRWEVHLPLTNQDLGTALSI